jgi:hypothetical protein
MSDRNRRRFFQGWAFLAAPAFAFLCARLSAADERGKAEEGQRERLKAMIRWAAEYTVYPFDDRKRVFKFHDVAAMRFTNPVGGTTDGALFFWSDGGQPRAILKFFSYDNERFTPLLQSLSEDVLVAERGGTAVWHPSDPGAKFRDLPDAPTPADAAAGRLRQMKSLARSFNATCTDLPPESKPVELRLLVQPIFRYETGDDPQCKDGAVFAFANGTAPQAVLLLESRKSGAGYRWHYAFARITAWAVTARQGEKEVFSVEKYPFRQDPNSTFLWLPARPLPKQ